HPICEIRGLQSLDQVTQPLSLLHPTLDGLITDFFEWRGAGTINPNPPLGAMWKAEGLFSALYFGFDLEQLVLRLDPDEDLQGREKDLRIECHLQTPTQAYRLSITPDSSDHYTLAEHIGSGSWQEIGSSRLIRWRKVLELALPFKDIHVEAEQILRMSVVVQSHGLEIARYPHHQPATLTVPGPGFEATMWRV
ncbi:MAG TPA: hypothetical protein VF819_01950, partial [Nitrospira sp.]